MHKKKLCAMLLAVAFLFGMVGCGGAASTGSAANTLAQLVPEEPALPYGPFAAAQPSEAVFTLSQETPLAQGQAVEVSVEVPAAGEYYLLLGYTAQQQILLRSTLLVQSLAQSCRTQVFSLWRDAAKTYRTDRFGNQVPAKQVTVDDAVYDYVSDQASVSAQPYIFTLAKGKQTLTLTSEDADLVLHSLQLVQAGGTPTYADYTVQHPATEGGDFITLEGEGYSVKTDSYIRAGTESNTSVSPYNYRLKSMNVLDAGAYKDAGQKVQYSFTVETEGVYNLSFHYGQNYKEDIPVYQRVAIDGRPLFTEMESVPFAYTATQYKTLTLQADGAAAGIYLEAGEHTLTLSPDGTPVAPYIARLLEIKEDLSAIGLDIKKISGTHAAAGRTWDVETYLPGVVGRLEGYRDELMQIYDALGALQQANPAAALNIKQAAAALVRILKEPDKIPAKISLLSEGSGSAAQLLSDQIDTLKGQNLSIDRIYLHSPGAALPKPPGALANLWNGLRRFVVSLFSTEQATQQDVLRVWVNRPIHYIDLMQMMADTEFTPQTGIRVEFSVMPSEQRIILSNATNMAPDVVMGVAANTPFDLGLRGAIADLTQFSDFAEVVADYNPETLVPYMLGDKVFGISETQEFYVLMVRTDIMDKLGLAIPQTWDDVAAMTPTLQRNSMNFYLQLSGYSGNKPLYSTAPFLMQAGGDIYGTGGLTTGINSAASLKGFETLTDLYRIYSLPQTVSSFYNSFRYGEIPLGIGSFNDYVKIKNAAPEITGQWEIALAPGIMGDDGVIQRGTTASATACAIMEQSEVKDDAWQFLKWWLSAETQIEFGNTLQTTYGPDYLWNTANLKAFAQLPFPEEDKEVILQQWALMQEIPRHPALYAVERNLSDAWQQVVLSGTSPRIALDNAALEIDREFERKLQEFGYVGSNGEVLDTFDYIDPRILLQQEAEEETA